MSYEISDALLLALFGAAGGAVLGLAARLGRFCTLGAIEDVLYQGNDTRLRMWAIAIGVAGLGAFWMVALGWLDPAQSIYHQVIWTPAIAILGGLMFGYGMALAGNCGFGALARFGGGDLRSFVVVLVMGISAYMALSGPLAGLRVAAMNWTAVDIDARSYPEVLAMTTNLPVSFWGLGLSAVLTAAALFSKRFLSQPKAILWGTFAGLAIVSGWAGTSWVATHGFSALPLHSHTYTAPLGETMIFLMTSSGGGLGFGVGSVFGVLAGAFAGSMIKGHFRWEACEDPRELKRQVMGAVLMGIGAILAMGCTVGQGMSAFSLMTLNAPLVFGAIFIGAAVGLRQLIEGVPFWRLNA